MTTAITQHHTDRVNLFNGDSCEVIQSIPDNSVDYIIFSPPFSSLFVYSASDRDMGNSTDDGEFFTHYQFLAKELYRVLKPGRLMSVHCMLLPTTKERDGYIGLRDFRGDLVRLHCGERSSTLFLAMALMKQRVLDAAESGDDVRADQLQAAVDTIEADLHTFPTREEFIFHSEVTIWKDPVVAMQRTKALGLLYKQLKKDSVMSRQGIADYLVTFRKPGVNPDPVTKEAADFPVDLWQEYASPVWMDINQTRTLQVASAREQDDERHVCPLQLDVIERAVRLWTRPDDVVLSPFAGIGSEIYTAVKMGRRGVGIELKPSYYAQATKNCDRAEQESGARTLFDLLEPV